MTKPPSLFKTPSDFELRKRQLLLFEGYYRGFVDGFYKDAWPDLHQWNIKVSVGDPSSFADSYGLAASDLFELWSLK